MANNVSAPVGPPLFGGNGSLLPLNTSGTIIFPSPVIRFRESMNAIEGKTWYELDVSDADIIVIIHEGKRIEIDKKDFLQKVGLEW